MMLIKNIMGETPKWLVLTTGIALSVIIYTGIVNPLWTPDTRQFDPVTNLQLTAPLWGAHMGSDGILSNSLGPFICLFLGFVCLLFGITRSINKLSGENSYLFAVFLILFSLSTRPILNTVASILSYAPIFHIHRISFYGYPLALFMFFFSIIKPQLHKWIWPLIFLPAAFSASVFIAFLIVGQPLQTPNWLWSELSAICFALFLIVGMFGAAQKSSLRFMRAVSLYWGIWIISNLIMELLGYRPFDRNRQFVIGVTISSVIIVCYLLFSGAKELFNFKREHELLDELIQQKDAHMKQIAEIKHEINTHMAIMKMNANEGSYTQLTEYLDTLNSDNTLVFDSGEIIQCGNPLISVILGRSAKHAEQLGFDISFNLAPLPLLSMPDTQLVSLLTNLLNNALESCEKIDSPEMRWIEVGIQYVDSCLAITVKNAFAHEVKSVGTQYISSKANKLFHGHGTSIVRKIAEKHGGFALFEPHDRSFKADVTLYVEAVSDV